MGSVNTKLNKDTRLAITSLRNKSVSHGNQINFGHHENQAGNHDHQGSNHDHQDGNHDNISRLSMGEWLLELDRVTRIRQEDKDSFHMYKVSASVAAWVLERISAKFGQVEFKLVPIGSYTLGLKVLSASEFDFLLIFTNDANDEDNRQVLQIFGYFHKWFVALQKRNNRKRAKATPRITAVYKHGPAWCIEVSWLTGGQEHRINIDITLGYKQVEPLGTAQQVEPLDASQQVEPLDTSQYLEPPISSQHLDLLQINHQEEPVGTDQKVEPPEASRPLKVNLERLKKYCKSLENSRVFGEMYKSLSADAVYLETTHSHKPATKSIIDQNLFDTMNNISPHVAVLYRLLKVFVALLLPQRVTACKYTASGYTTSNYISSHELKTTLCKYVEDHSAPELWSTEELPERVSDLLLQLQDKETDIQMQDFVSDGVFPAEVAVYSELRAYISGQQVCNVPQYTPIQGTSYGFLKEGWEYVKIDLEKHLKCLLSAENRLECLIYFPDNPLLCEPSACPSYVEYLRWGQYFLQHNYGGLPDIYSQHRSIPTENFAYLHKIWAIFRKCVRVAIV